MTPYERKYLVAEPLFPPLHKIVRKRLLTFARANPGSTILDVGGRRSHCTVGVPAAITMTDVPRVDAVQRALHLGINDQITAGLLADRSNITQVIVDDMTRSVIASDSFDYIVSVEVLEHVEEDALFIENIHRILKPGGTFLMTTPNGDSVVNTNPDHKRHYRREELRAVLGAFFDDPVIEYAIKGGRARRWSLQGWTPKHPFLTVRGMVGSVVNTLQSRDHVLRERVADTRHLIAEMRKKI